MKVKGIAKRKPQFGYFFEVEVDDLVSIPDDAEVTIEWKEPSPVHECSAQPEWAKIIYNGYQWNVWKSLSSVGPGREKFLAVWYCPYCGEKLAKPDRE